MKLNITEDELNKVSTSELLPVEEDAVVNGLPTKVKIKYLAEITSAKEELSKSSGGKMLVVTLSVWHPITRERIDIVERFPYSEKAVFRLKDVILMLKINPATADSDDFLGRWVWFTVKHESFTGKEINERTGQYPTFTNNKISSFVREATAEEVVEHKSDTTDAPTDVPATDGKSPW